jgi:NPCBM/NEW2 domain
MRKIALFLILMALSLVALAEVRAMPLLSNWELRAGHENMIWMDQRVKLGQKSVTGYIQGTGGSDDAIIGFEFKEDWDMLVATIGYKKSTPDGREAEWSVEAGGQTIYSSGIIESGDAAQEIRVPIRGHRRILLRISSEQYNGSAGASWGEPTVFVGLSEEEMKNDWSLMLNKHKAPLPTKSAPSEVLVPFKVPIGEEVEYRLKIRRDDENRTVIVEKERADS